MNVSKEAITKANKILHDLNFKKGKTTTQIVAEGLESYSPSLQPISEEDVHAMRVFISYAANSYKMINNKTSKSTVYRMIQSRASELNERLSMTTNSKKAEEGFKLQGHKCNMIALVETRLDDRKIWLGELTEKYNTAPLETHCLHIKTPLKDIVFGINKSDSWWLIALGQLVSGKFISDIRIKNFMKDCIGNVNKNRPLTSGLNHYKRQNEH